MTMPARYAIMYVCLFAVTLSFSSLTFAAEVASVKFHKIVARGDVMPGTPLTFSNFSDASTSMGNVVFIGYSQGHYGVYLYSEGELMVVTETGDQVPGGGRFTRFFSPAIHGDRVVFKGVSKDINGKRHEGIYLSDNGRLTVIVDDSRRFPGSKKNFTLLSELGIFGEEVVFRAFANGDAGILKYSDGELTIIAGKSVPIPDSNEVFAHSLEPTISEGKVAFQGYQHKVRGIYLKNGAKIEPVVTLNTKVPGTEARFENLTIPSLSGNTVAFWSRHGDYHNGIYRYDEKGLSVVADDLTQAPGKDALFWRFYHVPSVSNGKVAFMAEDSDGGEGIYLHDGKAIHKVVDSKSTIDGKQVFDSNKSLEGFRDRSYDQDYLTFIVKFEDYSRALYMAELPW